MGRSGPLIVDGEINIIKASASAFLGISGVVILADAFKAASRLFEWLEATKPTGLHGTAGFVERLGELGKDYLRKGWGPYWGAFRGKEVIADYESVSLTVGTTGSGKSVGVVVPMGLAIHASKVFTDFKGSLACMLAKALRARGERVRILNFANCFTDILGPSDTYNPMDIITKCFSRRGGLLEVNEILEEKTLQIYPEPEGHGSANDNSYFRNGSRALIEFTIMTCVLVDGEQATMGDVVQLINDRESVLDLALWAAGQLKVHSDGSSGASEIVGCPKSPVH
jgi:type IV secretory pathway TraG/TraD family ATPase VirD4